MKLIENKKSVSVIAALLILIFHLWIPVTGSNTENFLRQISYIGVDIFFFLSGLSLVKPIVSRKAFYLNRFKNVYLKFAFFAVFAAISAEKLNVISVSFLTSISLFLILDFTPK